MKKTTLSLFAIVAMTTSIWATVPYEFIPNTPAKASEVNANFSALSDKIVTLEKDVSDITSGGSCDTSPLSYTYSHIPSNVGDILNINGVQYIITALPFIEYGTGDRYYIKAPQLKSEFDVNGFGFFLYKTIYTETDTSCYPSTFAGFPASINTIEYSTQYLYFNTPDYVVTEQLSYLTDIKINKTKISMTMQSFYKSKEVSREAIAIDDYDLTDNISWENLGVDTSLVDDFKILMNYVEVVKIP